MVRLARSGTRWRGRARLTCALSGINRCASALRCTKRVSMRFSSFRHRKGSRIVQIGYLISDLDQLEDVATWGYDYAEAVPWLLDPDYLQPGDSSTNAAQAALARIRAAPIPVASLCGFLPEPEANGLMVVGPNADPVRL